MKVTWGHSEDVRSSYLGRKVSVIPTKLQFTILDSTRDVVAGSQSKKCGLKYVIYTPGRLIEMSWEYRYYC